MGTASGDGLLRSCLFTTCNRKGGDYFGETESAEF